MRRILLLIGTRKGPFIAASDEGRHWEVLFNCLPPIYSVEAMVD